MLQTNDAKRFFASFSPRSSLVLMLPRPWLMCIATSAVCIAFAFETLTAQTPASNETQQAGAVQSNQKSAQPAASPSPAETKNDSTQDNSNNADSENASPYQQLRFEEDWSRLRDKSQRSDFFDPIKYIPLGRPDWYLSIGGEARPRYERYQYEFWGSVPIDGGGYNLQRYMLHTDWRFGRRARVFFQFKSGIELGRRNGARPQIDEDYLDVHQAFADFNFGGIIEPAGQQSQNAEQGGNSSGGSGKHRITLRLGRQELSFGASRLVSTREGPNVRLSFDGARLSAQVKGWQLDAFAVKPVATNPGFFDDRSIGSQTFVGVYAIRKYQILPGGNVDLYYFGFDRKSAIFDQGANREIRHTIGTRIWGKKNSWDYNNEIIGQWGRFGSGSILAGAASGEVGYTFRQARFLPRVALKGDIITGDRNPTDRNLNTFNPLFPKNGYYQEVGLLTPANLVDVQPSVTLKLNKKTTLLAECWWFWRESLTDGLYNPGGVPVRTGRLSRARYVGAQPSLQLTWQMNRHATFVAVYTHFAPGDFLRETPPARSVNYFSTWIQYRF